MRACPRCSCLALVCALLTSLDLINARSEAAQYQVTVTQRSDAPLISFQGDAHYPGNSPWPQNFNPSWVQASSGTGGVEGLIIRAQNCSFAPGICTNCNVDDKHPIAPYFPGSVLLFAQHLGGSVFAPPYLIFSPSADAPQDETNGTEDPRIAFDAATGAYHLFYTCYGAKGPILCHAISSNPTLPHPGHWQRMGAVFPGMYGSKSAALLIKPQPPHVLLWGDSSVTPGIAFATSNDLLTFTTINTSFITPRPSYFDSYASCLAAANLQPWGSISPPHPRLLVESGPPPAQLNDGNFLFLYNSATVSSRTGTGSFGSYNVGWVIISRDGLTILQRSQVQRALQRCAYSFSWCSACFAITHSMQRCPCLYSFLDREAYLLQT